MADVATKFGLGAAPVIGNQAASATPSTSTSADLISAATNTGGIIITSYVMGTTLTSDNTRAIDLLFKVGGVTIGRVVASTITSVSVPGQSHGGFCNIEIAAGVAVSYTATVTSSGSGFIYLTWKAK